jgi:hydroxymethylglutaryl-CoA lyase
MSSLPEIVLTEECMRDGLQIERIVSVEQKLELLESLVAAGLKRIVVGSFVSPKWTPQMADTDELLARLTPQPGVTYLALALNRKGFERMRAWQPLLTVDETPRTHLHLDPIFIKRNTNRTMEQQDDTWSTPIQEATAKEAAIGLSAAWGSNFTGPTSRDARVAALERQFDAWSEAGKTVVSMTLADPMGWTAPSVLAEDLTLFAERFPTIREFNLHLHNTRGLALTSAYAAISSLGEEHRLLIDTAVGAIGGCPNCGNGQAAGMIPTEDMVQMLESMGVDTGVDLYRLAEASALLSEMVGRRLESKVSLAGPMPTTGDRFYSVDLPVIETLEEAQHFRLGPAVCEGKPRPWLGSGSVSRRS